MRPPGQGRQAVAQQGKHAVHCRRPTALDPSAAGSVRAAPGPAPAPAHLLHARPVDLSQQRQDQRLLAGARGAVEERVRAVARDHLQRASGPAAGWAHGGGGSGGESARPRCTALTSLRRLPATSLCSSNCSRALGRYCTARRSGGQGSRPGEDRPLAAAGAKAPVPSGTAYAAARRSLCLRRAWLLPPRRPQAL